MTIRSPKELAMLAISQRKKLGLTQTEVAEQVGLKQKTISAFENKPESVMLATAFLILSSLHLNLDIKNKDDARNRNWDQEW